MTASRFGIAPTSIDGVKVLHRKPIGDRRGYLERMFCHYELEQVIPRGKKIVQINRTVTSNRGTVRGMHFQHPPHAETKFITCLRGEIFDVAVDLRQKSETLLHWHGEVLSAQNHKTLIVPEGFAHGFQTLTEECEMLYFHTACYEPDVEGGLNAEDPRVGINWPLPISQISDRDREHPYVAVDFVGLDL